MKDVSWTALEWKFKDDGVNFVYVSVLKQFFNILFMLSMFLIKIHKYL